MALLIFSLSNSREQIENLTNFISALQNEHEQLQAAELRRLYEEGKEAFEQNDEKSADDDEEEMPELESEQFHGKNE